MKKKLTLKPGTRLLLQKETVCVLGGEIVTGADGSYDSGTCSCNWTCTGCCASIAHAC